ncbi:7159_t:CDS:2, partial [Acaulospora morrowiae]
KNVVTRRDSFWCSKSCRNNTKNWRSLIKSDQPCLVCKEEDAVYGNDFCGEKCEKLVRYNVPCIYRLSDQSNKFKDISRQFTDSWNHKFIKTPSVHAIYKIFPSQEVINNYKAYREYVESKRRCEGRLFPKGDGRRLMTKGNEQRRFHGTRMNCLLGITTDIICSDLNCAVCGIITNGYKLCYVGETFSSGRFGPGIYFSGASSKSNSFSKDTKRYNSKSYKVMFLNKVVAGRVYEMLKENKDLKGPPPNYDSVVGEPNKEGKLPADELVVYREEACLP